MDQFYQQNPPLRPGIISENVSIGRPGGYTTAQVFRNPELVSQYTPQRALPQRAPAAAVPVPPSPSGRYVVTNPYTGRDVDLARAENARTAFASAGYRPVREVARLDLERQQRFTIKSAGMLRELSVGRGDRWEKAGEIRVFEKRVIAQNPTEARLAGLPGSGEWRLQYDERDYAPRTSIIQRGEILIGKVTNRIPGVLRASQAIERQGERMEARGLAAKGEGVNSKAEADIYTGRLLQTAGRDIRERPGEFALLAGSARVLKAGDAALVSLRGSEALSGAGRLSRVGRATITGTRWTVGGALVTGFGASVAQKAYATGGDPGKLGDLTASTGEDLLAFGLGAGAFRKSYRTTGPTEGTVRIRTRTERSYGTTSAELGDRLMPGVKPRSLDAVNLESPAETLAASMERGSRRVESSPGVFNIPERVTTITTYQERFTGLRKASKEPVRTTETQHPSGAITKIQRAGNLRIVTRQAAGEKFTTTQVFKDGELVRTASTRPWFTGENPRIKFLWKEQPKREPIKLTINLKEPAPKPLATIGVRVIAPPREPIILRLKKPSLPALPRVTVRLTEREPRPITATLKLTGEHRPSITARKVPITEPPSEPLAIIRAGRVPKHPSGPIGEAYNPPAQIQQAAENVIRQRSLAASDRYVRTSVNGKSWVGMEESRAAASSISRAKPAKKRDFGRIVRGAPGKARIVRSQTSKARAEATTLRVGENEAGPNEYTITRGKKAGTSGALDQVSPESIILPESPRGTIKLERTITGEVRSRDIGSAVREVRTSTTRLTREKRPLFLKISKPQPKTLDEVRAGEPIEQKPDVAIEQQLERAVTGNTGKLAPPRKEVIVQPVPPIILEPLQAKSAPPEPKPLASTKTAKSAPVGLASEASTTARKITEIAKAPAREATPPVTRSRQKLGSSPRLSASAKEETGALPAAAQAAKRSSRSSTISQLNTAGARSVARDLTSDVTTITTPALRQEALPTTLQAQRQRTPGKNPGLPEELIPRAPPGGLTIKADRARSFNVLVRQRGKYQVVGRGLSIGKALALGRERVEHTTAATFKIDTLNTGEYDRALRSLGKKYTSSKREANVFIQRRNERIGTESEKLALQSARRHL